MRGVKRNDYGRVASRLVVELFIFNEVIGDDDGSNDARDGVGGDGLLSDIRSSKPEIRFFLYKNTRVCPR